MTLIKNPTPSSSTAPTSKINWGLQEEISHKTEAQMIDQAIKTCQQNLLSTTDMTEKQAHLFNLQTLKTIVPCPPEQEFVKPGANFRGRNVPAQSTDKLYFQKYPLRDPEGKIMTDTQGKIQTDVCVFKDFETYTTYAAQNMRPSVSPGQFYNGMTRDRYIQMNVAHQNRMAMMSQRY